MPRAHPQRRSVSVLQFPIPRIGLTALGIVALHLALIDPAHGATAGIASAVPNVGDGVQNPGFSTGPNAHGYSLSGISVRQVAWGTTRWDDTGGTVTLQAFKLDLDGGNGVWSTTPLALETATVSGETDGVTWNIS